MDKKEKRTQILTVAVVIFLCLVFVVGFVWGLNSVLAMEGSFPPVINEEGLTPAPQTPEEAVFFLDSVVKKAVADLPKVESTNSFDIDGETIKADGSQQLLDTLKFISDDFDDAIEEKLPVVSTDFSKTSNFRKPQITASDVESVECNYIYYKCMSCDDESDVPLDHCEDCGSSYPYEKLYRDEYDITLILKNSALNNFTPRNDTEIRELFGDGFNGCLDVKKIENSYSSLKVEFRVERLSNKITYLAYTKEMPVKASVDFTGEYSALGTKNIEFTASERIGYDFTWPKLELSAKKMNIEPKGTDNLLAALTCDDPTDYTVTWSSSNHNAITIDEEGYMKASKEPGQSIITASFEFNGVVYSDTCVVTVSIPVESMSISKRKIELKSGDTASLSVKVSPGDATVTTAKWYTENEKVAVVDENGVVKASAPGKTVIYALSDDGYFKSSCEVTVK